MALQDLKRRTAEATAAAVAPATPDMAAEVKRNGSASTSTPPHSRSRSRSRPTISTASTSATAGRSAQPSTFSSSSWPLYRYVVLPGNESVLLREALQRRPWWAEASGSQRWNLWAGLNGQRFTDWELLQPLPPSSASVSSASLTSGVLAAPATAIATASSSASPLPASPPASRRLVNRLQEHGLICTKSGLAGVLTAIQAAAITASSSNPSPSSSSPYSSSSPSCSPSAYGGGGDSSCGAAVIDPSWIPETYVVPGGPKTDPGGALARFRTAFAAHAAAGRRVWIAKPTCMNRGNGIQVFDSLERIVEHVRSRPAGSSLILQKYIERPMLLGGRKFDIRAYVLVGPDGRVWFHKEAYCRTSSTPYDEADLANRSAHLTNDAVQKHLDTYNAYEDHCKLSLEELGPALARMGTAAVNIAASTPASTAPPQPTRPTSTDKQPPQPQPNPQPSATPLHLDTRPGCEAGLWGAMRRCVAALFSAAGPERLNPRRLGHCFELLGLDFMLDAEGRLYLIEVNTSPALFRAGTYLSHLLPRLVEEVVQRAVDPLFPPPAANTTTTTTASTPLPPTASSAASPTSPTSSSPAAPGKPVAAATAEATATAKVELQLPSPLDGFVLVELDERLAAAVAAGTAARTAAGSRRSTTRRSTAGGAAVGVIGSGGVGAGAEMRKAARASGALRATTVVMMTAAAPEVGSGSGTRAAEIRRSPLSPAPLLYSSLPGLGRRKSSGIVGARNAAQQGGCGTAPLEGRRYHVPRVSAGIGLGGDGNGDGNGPVTGFTAGGRAGGAATVVTAGTLRVGVGGTAAAAVGSLAVLKGRTR